MRLDLGRRFGFVCFGLSFFCLLFSLVRHGTQEGTKISFVTKVGDRFTPPGFNQVIIASLLYFFSFGNFAHCSDIVGSKNPFFFFSISLCFNL